MKGQGNYCGAMAEDDCTGTDTDTETDTTGTDTDTDTCRLRYCCVSSYSDVFEQVINVQTGNKDTVNRYYDTRDWTNTTI